MAAKRTGANQRRIQSTRQDRRLDTTRKISRRVTPLLLRLALIAGVGAAAVYAAMALGRFATSWSALSVRSVVVDGVHRLDTAMVRQLSGIEPGMPLLAIDTKKACAAIGVQSWVRKVRVARRFPDVVRISVVERTPVCFVNTGRIWLCDAQGVLVAPPRGAWWDLPLISGLQDTLDGDRRRLSDHSLQLQTKVLEQVCRPWIPSGQAGTRISQVEVIDGVSLRCMLAGRPAVIDLDIRAVDRGLEQLARILQRLEKEDAGTPRRIDVRYGTVAYVQGLTRRESMVAGRNRPVQTLPALD